MKNLICFMTLSLAFWATTASAQVSACSNDNLVLIIRSANLTTAWHTAYGSHICINAEPSTVSCDLKMDLDEMDRSGIDIASWIKSNQQHICFSESRPIIRRAHEITQARFPNEYDDLVLYLEGQINKRKFFGYTFEELKTKIASYGTNKYKYIVLGKNIWGNIAIDFDEDYSVGDSNFSIPLIEELERFHNQAVPPATVPPLDQWFIKFIYETDSSGKVHTFIKLSIGRNDYYYDYSQDPTVGPMFHKLKFIPTIIKQ